MVACGGKAKCGGDEPHFRYIIHGVAVVWQDVIGQPYRARTVEGKFYRGDPARAIIRGEA